MNSISSCCEASMRPARSRIACRLVRSATNADICTAWLWCGIMSCMNWVSSGEWLVRATSTACSALSCRFASPGAPGWTIGTSLAALLPVATNQERAMTAAERPN